MTPMRTLHRPPSSSRWPNPVADCGTRRRRKTGRCSDRTVVVAAKWSTGAQVTACTPRSLRVPQTHCTPGPGLERSLLLRTPSDAWFVAVATPRQGWAKGLMGQLCVVAQLSMFGMFARHSDAVESRNSCSPGVVSKQAAESNSAFNPVAVAAVCTRLRKEQHVCLSLMIPLGVIVRSVFVQSSPKRSLAEQDQL
jgi:hypothetical protein